MSRFAAAFIVFVAASCAGAGSEPGGSGGAGGQAGDGGSGVGTTGGAGGGDSDAGGGVSGAGGASGASGGAGGAGGASQDAAPDITTDHDGPDGAREAAPDSAANAACPAGALLCENFEGYAEGMSFAPNWMTDNSGGMLRVDGTKPFAGARAAHFTSTAGTNSLLQIWKQGAPLFPIAGNAFYGRYMMWLSQNPTGPVHFNTVQANGLIAGTQNIAKYAYGAMNARLMAGYTVRLTETGLPTVDCGKAGTTAYPEKRWVCAEFKFDGSSNEMHYWLDGVAQSSVDVVKMGGSCFGSAVNSPNDTWTAPVFDKLMLGWYSQAFGTPIDLWIDDVVISTSKVGCPAP